MKPTDAASAHHCISNPRPQGCLGVRQEHTQFCRYCEALILNAPNERFVREPQKVESRYPHEDDDRWDAEPGEPELDDWPGVYPGYCISPELCRGKTHCPRSYSCVE